MRTVTKIVLVCTIASCALMFAPQIAKVHRGKITGQHGFVISDISDNIEGPLQISMPNDPAVVWNRLDSLLPKNVTDNATAIEEADRRLREARYIGTINENNMVVIGEYDNAHSSCEKLSECKFLIKLQDLVDACRTSGPTCVQRGVHGIYLPSVPLVIDTGGV